MKKSVFGVLALVFWILFILAMAGCPQKSEPQTPQSIRLNCTSLKLVDDETKTLTVIFEPVAPTNTNITWSISEPSIASISETGVVAGLNEGKCTITATSEYGNFTASCQVMIVKSIKPLVPVSLKNKTAYIGIAATNFGGEDRDTPCHQVKFTRDNLMCDHEVTQGEWLLVFDKNMSFFDNTGEKSVSGIPYDTNITEGENQENRPVEMVSWYDAIAWCNKRSLMENLTLCYSVKIDGTEVDWENLTYDQIPTAQSEVAIRNAWNNATCNWDANGYERQLTVTKEPPTK